MGKARSLVLLCALIAAGAARAGNDPDRRYFTIVTPHFAVHSHDGGEAFARDVADYLEEARTIVGELLGWYPAVRVHVVAADDFDSANGFASVLPHPAITVWAWPPPPDSELGNYQNWLKLLVIHEYVHIAHLDYSGGIPEAFNSVFGRVWKPNNALPRWATEGLAVWVESLDGVGSGRIGSAGTEAFFRTSALADRLPQLSDLTGSPLEQPRGAAWYFYGGEIYRRIAAHAGPAAVRRFVAAYGAWAPPYALNLLARKTTGKTLVDWFGEVRVDIQERSAATAQRVRAAGLREGLRIRGPLEVLEQPRFTPDGKHLLWLESDGDELTAIVAAPAPTDSVAPPRLAAPTRMLRCEGGCGRFVPTRDGTRLVYGTSRDYRRSSFYNQLAVVPLVPGESLARRTPRMLAASLRGYDPTPAADGRTVWAVTTEWSVPSFARFDLETGEVMQRIPLAPALMLPGSHARADRPVASADGRSLFVSLHADGNRDLYRVDIASGAFEPLTRGAADELDPHLSADERWLFYSSDRDGIFNIYALELATGVVRQATNVLTSATNPALSPDGRLLVYRAWTVDGPALNALAFEPATLPVVPGDGTAARTRIAPVVTIKGRIPYHPLPTLLPRSWLPSFTAGSSGAATVGLSVEALDATNRFGLVLSADWDLARDDWTGYASFTLRTGFPDVSLQLGRYSWDRTSFVGDLSEPYREEVVYSGASIALPVPDVFAGLTWGMGLNADLTRGLEVGLLEHTPDETMAVIPDERVRASLNMFASFSDIRQHPLAIAPSEGVSASFNLGLREPALGGDASAFTFTFVTRAHIPLGPLGHVLSFRLGGGLAGGDPTARSVFSLGGVPRQDLLSDLLNQTSAGAVWLRGFEESAFQGTRFGLLTGEWRFPLVRVRGGLGTLPVFLEDLTAAVFSDVGGASYDSDLGDDLVAGVGVELRFRVELWFAALYDFRLGYAHGFGDSGGDHVYFMMAGAP